MYIQPYVDFVFISPTLLVVFYLVGLSLSGHSACPICGPSLVTERPTLLGKVIYPNNHRFLPCSHSKYVPPSNGMEPYQWNMADWAKRWEEHHAQIPPPKWSPEGYVSPLDPPHSAVLGSIESSASFRPHACLQECGGSHMESHNRQKRFIGC